MGRHQGFDTTVVVSAARDVFWDKGFEEASLPELEHVTGLSRSSIYHAFGSKRGLFDAAVQNYLDSVVAPRLALLAGPDGVDMYFSSLAHDITTSTHHTRGCLLVGTAAGSASHDPRLADVVNDYRRTLTAAVESALRAQDVADPGNRARILVTMSIGALVHARVDVAEALAVIASARGLARSWGERG